MPAEAKKSALRETRREEPRRRRSQEERSEATKRQLLDATIDILLEQGYRRCTVAEICRRAGVTTGALQHHFGSKNVLVASVIEVIFPGVDLWDLEDSGLGQGLRERGDRLIDAYWDIYRNPRYLAVWEVVVGSRSEPAVHSLVLEHQKAATRASERRFCRHFADTGLPQEQLADLCQFITSELRGIALLRMFGDELETRDGQIDMLKDAIYRKLSDGGDFDQATD